MRADDNTRKILISVAEAAVNLFVALILVSSLLYFILVLLFGVDSIDALRDFTTASKDIMLSLLIIFGVILILAFLVMFIRWLSKDEEGIMILPFEVAAGDDKYSGKAISQLVTAELLRISRIHDTEIKYKGITSIESESLSLPVIAPSSENLTYTVTQMGPVGLGMTSIHIGPLMAILKRLWPGGDSGQVISGSLQRYGSVVSMVACLEHNKIRAWEASCDIEGHGGKGDDKIPGIAKDLAFKIIHDLQYKEISAKTWQGFRHFTDALDAYHQYSLTGSKDYLEMARAECLKAADSERGYDKIIKLIYNIGMAYANLKEFSKSEELLFQAISINPKDYSVLFRLGYVYGIQDQHQKALEYFDKALEYLEKTDKIDNKDAKMIWYNKGAALNGLKRYEEALEASEKAIALDPPNTGAWSIKGAALNNLKRCEEALEASEKAIALNPENAHAWYVKGFALNVLKCYEEALEAFDKAIALDSNNSDAWSSKGAALNGLKRYEEALEASEKAIALNPNNSNAWSSKGADLNNLKRYEEALDASEKAIALNPKNANAWYVKGFALNGLKYYKEALEALDRATDLDPQHAFAWSSKGVALNNLKRYEEALEASEKAIALNPENAHAWYVRGFALNGLKRYEEALEASEKAIALNPNNSNAWSSKGADLNNLKRYEEALEASEKAIALNPKNAHAWYVRGFALNGFKRYKEALEAFDKAITFDPFYASVWSSKGFALGNLKRYEEALEALDKAIEIEPKNATAHISLARLYRKLGREADRIEACKAVRDLFESESEYNRACFEAVCGSPDAALKLLRIALEKREQTADWARRDPDFEFIRDEPRFAALLDEFSPGGKKRP